MGGGGGATRTGQSETMHIFFGRWALTVGGCVLAGSVEFGRFTLGSCDDGAIGCAWW